MKLLDCTLRDGGHCVKFDWPIEMAKEHYLLMSEVGLDIIELGYWKQTSKFTTPFFNLNMDTVKKVVGNEERKNVSIMIDYHYCLKDVKEYPTNNQNVIKLIRMCSRKQDIKDALKFGSELKRYTGLEGSINVFNVSNYTKDELIATCEEICKYDLEYAYFADTHGTLDMIKDYALFEDAVEILKKNNKRVGFHFHNHTGKEYSNFLSIKDKGVYMSDATVFGIGKGAGNLRIEHVISDKDKCMKIIQFIHKYFDILNREYSTYLYVTGNFGICEAYATQAKNTNMPLDKFIKFCLQLNLVDRDIYNKELIKEYST